MTNDKGETPLTNPDKQANAAQREAIDLWTEGFSYREISDITGEGEGKLRVLVHRALKRLRNDPATQRILDGLGGSDTGRQSRQPIRATARPE